MIRPRPAYINWVALAEESDEAFNPINLGALGPDAFARRILSWTGTEVDGNRECHRNVLGRPLGPIVLVAALVLGPFISAEHTSDG
jgi:hypothetical protein